MALGREQHGVEFKAPGARTNSHFLAIVIRAMIAMANRRDGGRVLIGIQEVAGKPVIKGLSEEDAGTWPHDHLADSVATYADPRVDFDCHMVDVDTMRVIAIEVSEFPDVPVACKRSYQAGRKMLLRDGAIYVRSNRKPESQEIENSDEARELLDLATEKHVRRFMTQTERIGIDLKSSIVERDHRLFADEREAL